VRARDCFAAEKQTTVELRLGQLFASRQAATIDLGVGIRAAMQRIRVPIFDQCGLITLAWCVTENDTEFIQRWKKWKTI
jgi:hypothetical protein